MQQRVLITAGASGIGWAMAQAFLADGAAVHVFDIDPDAVAKVVDEHENLTGSVGDVTSETDVIQLVEDVREKLGGLDVLISNAGIPGPTAPVEEYHPAAWRSVLDVNLNGAFTVARHLVPLLKVAGGGTVLVMSSVAGRFGYPNRIGYTTAKWGLVGFTKTLALELGPHGITVNSLHPGIVSGSRLDTVLEARAEVSGRSVEDERSAALANQSVKAVTDPADIAALALFLAGPHARTISGQQLAVDGDSKAAQ
ncbi:SDR family oxidoreductase [Corynebacterium comes]|uniref:Diacetyl reductase [(S)-acetoin forming] n=1 Tax=Corynebacterium comes TaxID=2675218 RepID=A0A6B8VDP5_9CORY|nr:SDR family oxidoreductase [Corynebacterium comes]QGU03352.1 Diacetyl reductase [(S)-acetoin forming] [Corynebacterium comes]